ncbi:hypothetical protein JCM16303_001662 [Sporobolomyces ruberrimus]
MGVSGLWTELEPAHSITTWAQLSSLHFHNNKTSTNPSRGLRVGIDLSLWLCHVEKMDSLGQDEEGNEVNPGLNADLRCIFYRICRLLQRGILAVFVFDGPNKPSWKRGKYVGYSRQRGKGQDHRDLKEMFRLMGMEWRIAAGEAEAELAEMNQRGEIDAVLSDDVDSFLFGARTVIRNMSKTLSANKSKVALYRKATLPDVLDNFSPSKPSSSSLRSSQLDDPPLAIRYGEVPPAFDRSLVTFSYDDILSQTGLCREDMILVALMSGGDYSEGIKGCGVTTAKRLAEAGFGKRLLEGIKRLKDDPSGQEEFLQEWREEVAEVLMTNPNKLLEKKNPTLANKILESTDFPNQEIVRNYAHPRVSKEGSYDPPKWEEDIDIEGLVEYVMRMFEWGHDQVKAKFRNNLWVGILMRQLRRTALEQDQCYSSTSSSTSNRSLSLVQSVINFKCESSTDFTPSYSLHLDSVGFSKLIDPFLPRIDPFPFPEYDLYLPHEAETLRLERKRLGRAVERPIEPKTSDYRHWVPVAFVEVDSGCREKVRDWRDGKDRKEREKEEKEERKVERAKAKAEGKSSPVKKSRAKKSEGTGDVSLKRRKSKSKVESESEGEESEEKDTRKAIEQIRKEKVAKARQEILDEARRASMGGVKGKGKAKEDVFAATTTVTIPSSPALVSSDIEIVEPVSSVLRRPKKSISPPSFTLHNSFATTKSTLDSTAVKSKKTPPSTSTPFFTSTKRSVAVPPKRTIRPSSPSGSDSDESITIRSTTKHRDKANRLSKAHTSPAKGMSKSAFIELSSSEGEGGEGKDEGEELESLEVYLERREKEKSTTRRSSQGTSRGEDMMERSTSPKSSSAPREKSRMKERKKGVVETLVLSD